MCAVEPPRARAASTNSFSRSDSTTPRMVRAIGSQAVSSAMISATASQLLRFVAPGAIVKVLRASTAVTTSAGMHSTRSIVRPTTASTQPRR